MKGYIEEGGWVSCTMDSFGTPRQLERRRPASVKRKNEKYLLTKVDTAITQQFTCNSPMKFITGLVCLAGGFLAALSLLTPVGWIIFGAVAVAAVLVTTVVASHMCNSALEGTEWVNFHNSVKIDRQNAVLYFHSTMTCSYGGQLIASETFEQANQLSNQMALNVWGENLVHGLSQFAVGFIAGKGAKSPIGIGVNATLTAGLHLLGEFSNNSALNNSMSGLKIVYSDKFTYLIENSKTNTISFKGFAKGVLLAGMAAIAIDLVSNEFEDYLESLRKDKIEAHKANTTGKSIVAKDY